MTEDELLAELGIGDDELLATLGIEPADIQNDITVLRHVRSSAKRRASEKIAVQVPCDDFYRFKTMFEVVTFELNGGIRKSSRFGRNTSISRGDYFILNGLIVYVDRVGDDARLRVIYSNETESNLLVHSLQRALYKDKSGRRITKRGN